MRPTVELFTRQGCGVCRRGERLARREAWWARLVVVDVDDDAVLAERYGARVPVVTIDGVEVAELEIAPGEIRQGLSAWWRSRRQRRQGRTFDTGGTDRQG